MKSLSNYKIYLKAGSVLDNFPKRINYFHRTKWKYINRNFFLKKIKRHAKYKYQLDRSKRKVVQKFKNFFSPKSLSSKNKFTRMRRYPTESLRSKNKFLQIFDNSLKCSVLKKDLSRLKGLSRNQVLKLLLIKQIYFVNVFLWKVHFFSSSSEASSYIDNGLILVNGKRVYSNYFLRAGDILEFKDSNLLVKIKQNLNKYRKIRKMYSFVEIDYYIYTLVIVKNYDNFVADDLSLLFSRTVKTSSVYNIFR